MKHGKFEPQDFIIRKLDSGMDLDSFNSYETELVNFLKEDALSNQRQNLSLTYLWFYKGNLVGYITLLTDKINLEGNLKVSFQEKGIYYKSLPSLKIGRLCVHDEFLRQGIGRLMILSAIQIAFDISRDKAGCRFITLDAKRNPVKSRDSIHFYKKLNFRVLRERIKGSTPMFLDLLQS